MVAYLAEHTHSNIQRWNSNLWSPPNEGKLQGTSTVFLQLKKKKIGTVGVFFQRIFFYSPQAQ